MPFRLAEAAKLPNTMPHPAAQATQRLLAIVGLCVLWSCAVPPQAEQSATQPPRQLPPALSGPLKSCDRKALTEWPQWLSGEPPYFPIGLLLERRYGAVHASFDVTEAGLVDQLEMRVEGVNPRDAKWFVNHVEIAARTWKLAPARLQDVLVRTRCRLVFDFKPRW